MSPREEAVRLLELCEGNLLQALGVVEGQLNVLYGRAQVLLSLAGVLITVTGFSGRTIAGTSMLGKISIVLGLSVVLASAVWIYARVMRVRWVTRELDGDPSARLEAVIRRRDAKTRAFNIGGAVLCAGFAIYCVSVAVMLLGAS
jgi:uncharacterized membrane protein